MASRAIEAEIDKLYQLPLDEFTRARNELAKGSGTDAKRIKALAKPPIAAWAVNQLHWKSPDLWNELVAAGENAQRAHRAVLAGRSADVRAASKVHDEAVEKALRATLKLLEEAGHPAADATKHAIGTTLRALPGDEAAGRFTRPLQPAGFGQLTGLQVSPKALSQFPKAQPPKTRSELPKGDAKRAKAVKAPAIDVKALTRARQAAAEAARILRDAENAVRRDEFEKVRAEREEKRAAEAADKAARLREAAEEKAEESQRALTTARARVEAAAAALKAAETPR
jgi:hypothetical protein